MPAKQFKTIVDDPACAKLIPKLQGEIHEMIQQVLRAMPLFEDVEAETLQECSKLFAVRYFAPHATIVEENGVSDEFFVLLAGAGNITKKCPDGSEALLFTARPGDYFGELGLLKDQPRQATVRSLSGKVDSNVTRLFGGNGTISLEHCYPANNF